MFVWLCFISGIKVCLKVTFWTWTSGFLTHRVQHQQILHFFSPFFKLTVDVLLEQLDLAPRESALFWRWRAVQFWVWVLLQSDSLDWKLQMCKTINSYKIKWNSIIIYENECKSRRHGLNNYCFFFSCQFIFFIFRK